MATLESATRRRLTCGVPDIEPNGTEVGFEGHRVDIGADGGHVKRVGFAGQVTLPRFS
jgi:hypothetical protein